MGIHKRRIARPHQFTARSGNICNFAMMEKAVDDEIRIAVDAEWMSTPTDEDTQAFYDGNAR